MGNTLLKTNKKINWDPDGVHKKFADKVIDVTDTVNNSLKPHTFKDITNFTPEEFNKLNIEAQNKFYDLTYEFIESEANNIRENFLKDVKEKKKADPTPKDIKDADALAEQFLNFEESTAFFNLKSIFDDATKARKKLEEIKKRETNLSPEVLEARINKVNTIKTAAETIIKADSANLRKIPGVTDTATNLNNNNIPATTESFDRTASNIANNKDPDIKIAVEKVEKSKFLQNFDKKVAACLLVAAVAVLIGCGLAGVFDKKNINTTTPKPSTGNITTTPNPSQTGQLTPVDVDILISLIAEKISGCYMFTNNGGKITATRLDGCSNWYNNMDNQFYCSCFKTTDTKTLPTADDCKDEACNSPYCMNQSQSSCKKSDTKKCNVDNQQLYMCNGNSINDEGFVFYAYQYFPPEGVMAVLTEIAENENKSNIVPIIIGSVIIIVVIFAIIYLMMHSKKGKKGRKNK